MRDRKIIASLYLQGWLQVDIAKEVGLVQQTVSKELAIIRSTWEQSTLMDFSARMGQELAKIDLIEMEYWGGWERSRATITWDRVFDQDTQEWVVDMVVVPNTKAGDPRFIEGARKCVQQRCDMLGLKAPDRLELTGANGKELAVRVISGINLDKDI